MPPWPAFARTQCRVHRPIEWSHAEFRSFWPGCSPGMPKPSPTPFCAWQRRTAHCPMRCAARALGSSAGWGLSHPLISSASSLLGAPSSLPNSRRSANRTAQIPTFLLKPELKRPELLLAKLLEPSVMPTESSTMRTEPRPPRHTARRHSPESHRRETLRAETR